MVVVAQVAVASMEKVALEAVVAPVAALALEVALLINDLSNHII